MDTCICKVISQLILLITLTLSLFLLPADETMQYCMLHDVAYLS